MTATSRIRRALPQRLSTSTQRTAQLPRGLRDGFVGGATAERLAERVYGSVPVGLVPGEEQPQPGRSASRGRAAANSSLLDEAVATAKTATAKQVEYEEKYIVEAKKRKKFMGELEDIRGNVRVYARIRPLSSTERAKTEYFDAEHPDGMCLRFPHPELGEVLEAENPQNHGTFKPFKFNQVFGPGSTQERVFQEVAPLVERAMDGFNVCVFAYGQSGR